MGADLDLASDYDQDERERELLESISEGDLEDEFLVAEEAWAEGERQQAPEVLEDDIAQFLMARDESFAQPRRIEEVEAKQPTKRAMRMGAKKDLKEKNKFCVSAASTEKVELAKRISMLKPGGRGRVSKALADPYGCHAENEL